MVDACGGDGALCQRARLCRHLAQGSVCWYLAFALWDLVIGSWWLGLGIGSCRLVLGIQGLGVGM